MSIFGYNPNKPRAPHPHGIIRVTCPLCGEDRTVPDSQVDIRLYHGAFEVEFTCSPCNRRVDRSYLTGSPEMRQILAKFADNYIRTHIVDDELEDTVRSDRPKATRETRQALEADVCAVLAATPMVIAQWCGKYRSEH